MTAPFEKHQEKLHTFIERWKGGKARLWEFTVSHRRLTIRVEKEGQRGNLHIYCGALEQIHGPTAWNNCCFEMIHRPEGGFILQDKSVDFSARSEGLDVVENCKPIY